MQNKIELTQLRIDKWLWAARFFKTRGVALDAIAGGKVHLNNMRVKPAKKVNIGDNLVISKGEMIFNITVLGINDKRRPAKEATLLYEEDIETKQIREKKSEYIKEKRANNKMFAKADKKQKRNVRRMKGESY
jgi:ribosome-associated heat shock protein Hsp15